MARISNTAAYPNIGTPTVSDYLILTDADNDLVTKSCTLGNIQSLFGIDSLYRVLTVGSSF